MGTCLQGRFFLRRHSGELVVMRYCELLLSFTLCEGCLQIRASTSCQVLTGTGPLSLDVFTIIAHRREEVCVAKKGMEESGGEAVGCGTAAWLRTA